MSYSLGTLTISAGTNATQEAPSSGAKAVIIGNESALTCKITMEGGGVAKTLYPGVVDWFEIRQGFTGNIQISPSAVLLNGASFPSAC